MVNFEAELIKENKIDRPIFLLICVGILFCHISRLSIDYNDVYGFSEIYININACMSMQTNIAILHYVRNEVSLK